MSDLRARTREAIRRERIIFVSIVGFLILVALLWSTTRCNATDSTTPTTIGVASPSPTIASTPKAQATATPQIVSIAFAANIPSSLRADIEGLTTERGWNISAPGKVTDLLISNDLSNGAQPLTERIYVVVAAFPTWRDQITFVELQNLWQRQLNSVGSLYVPDDAVAFLTNILGSHGASVKSVKSSEITARLWSEPSALGIIAFDQLNPKLAAFKLDDVNVLSRNATLDRYPLIARTWAKGDANKIQLLANALRAKSLVSNRNADRLTTLVMTGTSAIARGTAFRVEQVKDPAYPARKIAPVISQADIVHVSNEIPFVEKCQVNPTAGLITFCSHPSYMETYKLLGTKIVGLTGNHILDYGTQNFLKTLDLYKQNGMRYYGGGRDATEAAQPLLITDHGNRLAFVGANSFGPATVWAKPDRPGAAAYDADSMTQQIAALRKQADVVLVEMQADETYDYKPNLNNRRLFRKLIADGADVVTGVQAHQPQAIEFSEDGKHIILYGLGNLFFDQEFSEAVQQGLIVRHTIYQGHLIQSEILTTMLEERAQPRFATPAERERILRAVFSASGFKIP